jgi:hypothetical protein
VWEHDLRGCEAVAIPVAEGASDRVGCSGQAAVTICTDSFREAELLGQTGREVLV